MSNNNFDSSENYIKITNVQEHELYFFDAETFYEFDTDDIIQKCIVHITTNTSSVQQQVYNITINNSITTKSILDYSLLRPLFSWFPTDTIKRTFSLTTQYSRTPISIILKKNYKYHFPALNVHHRSETVATDTVYYDTPTIDNGSTSAQIFVGTKSIVTDVYGMKTDKQFFNILEDNIRQRVDMDKFISDRAQVEIIKRVLDILCALCIGDWQSEPYLQHKNFVENRYQTVKTMTNTLLDRTGSPPSTWLLALMYI